MTDYKHWEKFDENSANKEMEEFDETYEFETKLNKSFGEQQNRNEILKSSLIKISESLKSKVFTANSFSSFYYPEKNITNLLSLSFFFFLKIDCHGGIES